MLNQTLCKCLNQAGQKRGIYTSQSRSGAGIYTRLGREWVGLIYTRQSDSRNVYINNSVEDVNKH